MSYFPILIKMIENKPRSNYLKNQLYVIQHPDNLPVAQAFRVVETNFEGFKDGNSHILG